MNAQLTKQVAAMALSGTALGLGLYGTLAAAQGSQNQSPSYQSSITVPEQEDDEQAEAAKLAPFAKIDANQATAAALAKVPGTVMRTALDNENGNLVYSVEIRLASNEVRDVKVDAGNGAVLQADAGGEDQADERNKALLQNPFSKPGSR
jgi:uncharacterized membrane protein YkoI